MDSCIGMAPASHTHTHELVEGLGKILGPDEVGDSCLVTRVALQIVIAALDPVELVTAGVLPWPNSLTSVGLAAILLLVWRWCLGSYPGCEVVRVFLPQAKATTNIDQDLLLQIAELDFHICRCALTLGIAGPLDIPKEALLVLLLLELHDSSA